MIEWLKRLVPPSAPPVRRIPLAVAQAAVFGALAGPLLGLLFGWTSLFQTVTQGAMYAVFFYSLCALPASYARRHFGRHLSPFAGLMIVVLVSLVVFGVFSELKLDRHFVQVSVVVVAFTLVWGEVIAGRERLEAARVLAVSRAQTRTLQARMNPHFFFNTLNTIASLIPENPEAAQQTIGLLADMNRYAFNAAEAGVVPLVDELAFARAYLKIERIRFGDRLQVDLPDDSAVQDVSLPIFTLQPLLENAVRHGIGPRVEGGMIRIRIERNEDRFSISVGNEASSASSRADFFKAGHALDNIRERLKLIYRGRASIDVSFALPDRVTVRIQAPCRAD